MTTAKMKILTRCTQWGERQLRQLPTFQPWLLQRLLYGNKILIFYCPGVGQIDGKRPGRVNKR
jgi:hypothetical protein